MINLDKTYIIVRNKRLVMNFIKKHNIKWVSNRNANFEELLTKYMTEGRRSNYFVLFIYTYSNLPTCFFGTYNNKKDIINSPIHEGIKELILDNNKNLKKYL